MAMTRYVGERQIGKKLPGPLPKQSRALFPSSLEFIRDFPRQWTRHTRRGARGGEYSSADASGNGEYARDNGVGRGSGAGWGGSEASGVQPRLH